MSKRPLLAAALLLFGSGLAFAQRAPTFDPNQLPSFSGKVAQYSLTPRGDVDGLILTDGTEVHLPPHLGVQLVFAIKPGDMVTVRGLRARAVPMVQAMSVSNDASGATVIDRGPADGPSWHDQMQPLNASGRIKEQLHGARGDADGLLLEDGTIVRMAPAEMERLAPILAAGAPVVVRGSGIEGPLGRVIEARAIGPDANQLTDVLAPPPPGPGRRSPFASGDGPAPPPAPGAPAPRQP